MALAGDFNSLTTVWMPPMTSIAPAATMPTRVEKWNGQSTQPAYTSAAQRQRPNRLKMAFTIEPSVSSDSKVPTHGSPQHCIRRSLAAAVPLLLLGVVLGCPTEPLVWEIEALEVVENPGNLLSRTVRWSTAEPTTSHVEFGEDDAPVSLVGSDERVTEHEVLVFGLRAETSYTLHPVSTDAAGTEIRAAPVVVETAELPFESPVFQVSAYDASLAQPGWTMTNLMVDGILSPTVVVMVDMEGRVVWYHQVGTEPAWADVDATLLDDGTVLIGGGLGPGQAAMRVDMAGNEVWLGPVQPDVMLGPGSLHHVFRALPNGNYLTLSFDEQNTVLEDVILELAPDGEVVWEWHAADHLAEANIEHIHSNMALADLDQGVFYLNALLTRSFYKIDRETGEVLWAFGEGRDFEMLTDHEWPWVDFCHAPEIQPNGHVLMYDNGGQAGHDVSRAVEYALDEEAMTAELVWEYPGELADDHWFTQFWGDADRLENGNTLITSGSVIPLDTPSRILEVTEAGEKAWQLEFASPNEGGLAGCYSSERIPVLVESL